MDRLRNRFLMLVVPVALVLFGSFLLAQGPPNNCAKTCQQIYADAVKSWHGDQACLAAARGAALNCLKGCGQPQ
jgi:hypothetical protein